VPAAASVEAALGEAPEGVAGDATAEYHLAGMNASESSSFEFRVVEADEASAGDLDNVFSLFEANYRRGNRAYLEKSLATLRYLALAEHEGAPAGFALGECRVMDLPRLPGQPVNLAGICCIAPQFRRRNLFTQLEVRAFAASGVPWEPRVANCGRMAHPAALRVFRGHPTLVPKPGVRPTPWQQGVGQAIAEAYGVHAFDPETFVCIGSGVPIGYPVIEFEVGPEEWEVFRAVNRDRGYALLSMIWIPDAPEGW
jgi:hypothetical protein